MKEIINDIAARVKDLREIMDCTTEDVAKELGIAHELYEKYEKTGDFPISVIFGLEKLFHVDYTEIARGNKPILDTYQVVRKGHGHPIQRFEGKYRYKELAYNFANKIMQPTMVTMSPSDEPTSELNHAGEEFNLVTKGSVVVTINREEIILKEGDSIYFDANIPHSQRAHGDKEARFLAVIAEKKKGKK